MMVTTRQGMLLALKDIAKQTQVILPTSEALGNLELYQSGIVGKQTAEVVYRTVSELKN